MSFYQKAKNIINKLSNQKLLFLIGLLYFYLPFTIISQNTWTQKADFGGVGRVGGVSATLNGKGYAGLGTDNITDLDDWWEYDADLNTWTQKASFNGVLRSYGVMFEIDNIAYFGTGQNSSGSLSDFFKYDPIANTWSTISSMPGLSRGEAYSFSINGKGYVGCGVNRPSLTLLQDFYEYDPVQDAWTQKSNFPGSARASGWSFTINDKGYFGTGSGFLQDVYEYNPLTNIWVQKANYGGGGYALSGRFVIGCKGYVVAGRNSSNQNTDIVYEFDPILNTWIQKASIPGGLNNAYWQFGFTIEGKGYIGTGAHTFMRKDFYEYTPGTSPSVNTTIISNITTNTATSGGDVIFDGNYSVTARGVVWSTSANPTVASQPGGGISSNGTGNGTFTSSLTGLTAGTQYYYRAYATNSQGTSYGEQYTFTTTQTGGTWARQTDFIESRWFASSFSIDNKGYIIAGGNGSVNLNDTWEYDPTTCQWTQKADFGGGLRHAGVAFSIGDKGYFGTGSDGTTLYNDFWEYDPNTNVWTQRANFGGVARYTATGISTSTKGYIGTGYNNSIFLNDWWEFDPTLNSWIQKANFGGVSRNGAISFTINDLIYLGLGQDGTSRNDLWEFNPANNTWTQKANFTGSARYYSTSYVLNNIGYVACGFDGSNKNDVFSFDPLTNSWTSRTNFIGSSRHVPTSFVIENIAFVGLGNNGSFIEADFYSYKPNSEPTLTTTAISAIATTSASSGGNVIGDGGEAVTARGLVWSSTNNTPTISDYEGITSNGTGAGSFTQTLNALCPGTTYYVRAYATNSIGTSYGTVESFTTTNSAGDIWVQKANFGGGAVRYSASSFVIDNKIYVGLGNDGTSDKNDFWYFDTDANTWTQVANFISTGRQSAISFSIGTMGYIGPGNGAANAIMYEYNTISNSWSAKNVFSGGIRSGAVYEVYNGKAYVGMGVSGASTYLNDWWEYDPTSDSWRALINFPGANRWTPISFVLNGEIYVGLGSTNLTSYSDFYKFNINSNTWTQLKEPSLPIRNRAVSFSIGNKGYISTGRFGLAGAYLNDLWEYDYMYDVWINKTSFPSNARVLASGSSVSNKGYIGLGSWPGSNNSWYEYTPSTFPTYYLTDTSNTYATSIRFTAAKDLNFTGCQNLALTGQGLVWHTSTNPTTSSNTGSYAAGSGNGFDYTISGLSPATTYYARAYTTTAQGTQYGNEFTFITNDTTATITTTAISSIATTTASSGGNVTSDGGDAVIARGLVWSSSTNTPTISNYDGITTNGTGTGSFTQTLNALCPGTTYYVRAYATNSIGTSYGAVESFTTTNSAGDIWVQKANFGGINRIAACSFNIGIYGYIGLGYDLINNIYTNDFWEYNQSEDIWTQKADFSGTDRGYVQSFVIGTNAYIIGSGNFDNDVFEYNQINNTWTQKADFSGTGRGYGIGFSILGKGYIGFGWTCCSLLNDLWEYDPNSDSWVQKSSLPAIGRQDAVVFVINNVAYIGGGWNNVLFNDFWKYDQANDSWSQIKTFPGNFQGKQAVFTINEKGYVQISGQNVWEYNPSYDIWVQKSDYIGASNSLNCGLAIGNKGYIATGFGNGQNFYEYTPSTIRKFYLTDIDSIVPISAKISVKKDDNFNGCVSQAITDKGIVWDINPNPTISSNLGKYGNGTVNQDFEYKITGLSGLTTYYVRPYTTTIQGTIYGNEESFTTPAPTAPILGITSINGVVGDDRVSINHSINSDGYSDIIQSGIVYSTSANPDVNSYIGGNKILTSNSISEYNTTLENLLPETTFYLRFYSTNSIGTTYSNEIIFTTNSISNDDDIDGINDISEELGPNDGDGNDDGIPDNLQANVATFYIDENGKFVTVEATNCASLSDVKTSSPEVSSIWRYPFGVIEFTVPCSDVDMHIYYHGVDNLNDFVYRKTNSQNRWITYEDAIFTLDTIGGNIVPKVIFPLSDGLRGDADGTVNGSILDPGGPAILVSSSIANIPTLTEWSRIMIISLMLLFGILLLRKSFS